MKNRYVCKNSQQLGIDNYFTDENGDFDGYMWYVWDKEINCTIDGYEGSRSYIKSVCDRMNNK